LWHAASYNRHSENAENTTMSTRTPSQQIAELEAKIARLRQKDRALENGQKIILGGMLLNAARTEPKIRQWVINEASKITRPADAKRLAPLLEELREVKPAGFDSTQIGTPKTGAPTQTGWGLDAGMVGTPKIGG
jgi:hypothetical protein